MSFHLEISRNVFTTRFPIHVTDLERIDTPLALLSGNFSKTKSISYACVTFKL